MCSTASGASFSDIVDDGLRGSCFLALEAHREETGIKKSNKRADLG